MFGPTFANLGALSSENAIVINEGDYMGRIFFLDLYRRLGLNVHEYSFEEHPHFWQHRNYGKVNFTFFAKNLDEN